MALSKIQGAQIETPVDISAVNVTGSLGIGTTNPTEKVDVVGNVKVSGLTTTQNLYVTGVSTFTNAYISSGLGIGTTNPSRTFQVFNSTNAVISAKNDSIEGVLNATSNSVNIGSASNDFLTISVNGDEKSRFQTDGNIGIGTTNAGDKVVIQQNTDDNIILRINGEDHVTEFAGLGVGPGYASFVAGGSATTNTDMILFSASAGVESEGARLTSAGILSCKLGNNTFGLSSAYALHLGQTSSESAGAIRLDGTTTGCHGLIQATNQNLHIDAVRTTAGQNGLFLNFYDGDFVSFGAGGSVEVGRFWNTGKLSVGTATTTGISNTKLYIENGNIEVSNGYGINFGATSDAAGMTSELFNNYEEGTWTPELRINNSTTGITYTSRSGYYTLIGRMVFMWGAILLSSKGSNSGSVGIFGQPFSAGGTGSRTHPPYAAVFWDKAVSTDFNIIQIASHIQFRSTASTTDTQLTNTDLNNNTAISFGSVFHI